MSASLVSKSLNLVESFQNTNKKSSKERKVNTLKLNNRTHQAGRKLTVTEARKKFKSKETILKENLKKLEIIQKTDKINLDKETIDQIIERAVTRKPVKKIKKKKSKKDKKTAFTEEDFKKFEQEYFDDEPL